MNQTLAATTTVFSVTPRWARSLGRSCYRPVGGPVALNRTPCVLCAVSGTLVWQSSVCRLPVRFINDQRER